MASILNIVENFYYRYKITKLFSWFFGNDIFISYSRIDGLDYALELALKLGDKGFQCYVDQLSSNTPGKQLPEKILDEIKSCTELVIIGSEGSCQSENVNKEISEFRNRKKKPIVVIDVDDNVKNKKAIWNELVEGLAFVRISNPELKKKEIDSRVIDRIVATFKFKKRTQILNRIFKVGVVSFLLLLGLLLLLFKYEKESLKTDLEKEISKTEETLKLTKDSLSRAQKDFFSIKDSTEVRKQEYDRYKNDLSNLGKKILQK